MRAVILAAGYGTRLECDLQNDISGQYKHLLGVPKPLLPVAGVPLITHWITSFVATSRISSIVVIVNDLHRHLYERWCETLKMGLVNVVSDGSTSNEGRSGAVACMALGAFRHFQEDTLFVAGDTLLKRDFSMMAMIDKFELLQEQEKEACLVLGCPVLEENVSKHGIIEVAESGRVTKLLEKPEPEDTISRLQCPCVYLISAPALPLIQKFLDRTRDQPLSCRDATGKLLSSLVELVPVYCLMLAGRYDVGGLQSYLDCCREFPLEQ